MDQKEEEEENKAAMKIVNAARRRGVSSAVELTIRFDDICASVPVKYERLENLMSDHSKMGRGFPGYSRRKITGVHSRWQSERCQLFN